MNKDEEYQVIWILFNELVIGSNDSTDIIDHLGYPIQEASKITGQKRFVIKQHLEKLVGKGIINVISKEPLKLRFTNLGKNIKTKEELIDAVR
jgi:hypothetical protein